MATRIVPFIALVAMTGSTGAHAAFSGVRERFGAPGTPTLVVAHRGCHNPAPHHGMPDNAPENSISGIERCITMGVDVAEVDVRRTKDGFLVLMHDETVDRTTNGQGKVVDLTLAQIRAFVQRQDEGGAEAPLTTSQVPTLDEALAAALGRIMINLDVQAGLYADVIATVHRLGQEDGVIVKEPAGAGSPVLTQIAPFDRVPFMPILEEGGDLAAIAARQTSRRPPIAMELPRMSPDQLPALAAIAHKTGTRLWINSLWEGFVHGFGGDVAALRAPDMVWGRLQRSGVSVIQTDEPEALLRFLKRGSSTRRQSLFKRHLVGAALAMAVAAPAISAAPEAAIARTRQAFADPKSQHIITVAHRACWESAPENSLAAVNACVALGVDSVEMDVRTTRDGVPVIMHDETVDRTTNGHGRVADLTAAYISTLRLKAKGGGAGATLTMEHVPTLDEYLAAAKDRIMLVFDVKDGTQQTTFAHIQRASMADQAIFFYECVDRTLANAIAPFRDKVVAIPIMFGKDGPLSPEAERCASNPPGWAHVKWSDPAWLHQTAASQDQHPVRLWTATMFPQDNDGYDDKRALGDPNAVWGAQIAAGAGMIMTNQPSALIRYLKSLKKGA